MADQQLVHGNPSDSSFESTGLCILSLDGGGVRGLSTLYVLQRIMSRLNDERREIGLPDVKPCEVFDLIGGTSTGGLIAIMLGRLEMDVHECILAYTALMGDVFEKKSHWLPLTVSGRTQGRYDSSKLKDAIEKVIQSSGFPTQSLFNQGKPQGSRVFVCAVDQSAPLAITRLRSYDVRGFSDNLKPTICDAALATSAATTVFEPVSIRGRSFVDGALGANNPVNEVENEASNIWCPDTGELKPLLKCFVSIGTGKPDPEPMQDTVKGLAKTVGNIATETEATARHFIGRYRRHYDENRYFRFNVEGIHRIGLTEHTEGHRILAATELYLDDQARQFRVRDCVANLRQKECVYIPTENFA
ncbi:phospholipase [Xylaria sp. FL0043]|nr:phospholipase [Xylaria sp. FL0043]